MSDAFARACGRRGGIDWCSAGTSPASYGALAARGCGLRARGLRRLGPGRLIDGIILLPFADDLRRIRGGRSSERHIPEPDVEGHDR